jgi:NACalpha-BTF3-like transcription factor
LYVIVDNHGIVVVNLEGNFINTIIIDLTDVADVERITIKRDRIYYTNFKKDIVKCCTLAGDEIWSFHDDSVNTALGIAVDNISKVNSNGVYEVSF